MEKSAVWPFRVMTSAMYFSLRVLLGTQTQGYVPMKVSVRTDGRVGAIRVR